MLECGVTHAALMQEGVIAQHGLGQRCNTVDHIVHVKDTVRHRHKQWPDQTVSEF